MKTFLLPDLGEGLQDAEIVAWHVSPGDHVVADQPLLSVETAKAVVEVPSPWSGVVRRLHVGIGAVVPVGAPLADIDDGGATADAGAIVGDLPQAAPERAGPAPARPEGPMTRTLATQNRATPAVRRRARELGLDLDRIPGTGPGGAILTGDLDAARAADDDGWTPLRGVRRAMARSMTAAAAVPATTLLDRADVTGWRRGADATVRLARAIVAASRAEPALNAWYDPERGARRLHDPVDLGIAMDTADGLFAPVLRDAGAASAPALRERLEALKQGVRDRTIAPGALRGQTITLSNFGPIGGRHAALMVVPPQVAILGSGRIEDEAAVVDGALAVRRALPLSLTFDHRAVTGGEAARFLMAVIDALQRSETEPHG